MIPPRNEREVHARSLRNVWGHLRDGKPLPMKVRRVLAKMVFEAARFLDQEQEAVDRFLNCREHGE